MPSQIRANYKQLGDLSQQFSDSAYQVNLVSQQVDDCVDSIRGAWQSDSVGSFITSINERIVRPLSSLRDALDETSVIIEVIARLMADAETEASRLFEGDGHSNSSPHVVIHGGGHRSMMNFKFTLPANGDKADAGPGDPPSTPPPGFIPNGKPWAKYYPEEQAAIRKLISENHTVAGLPDSSEPGVANPDFLVDPELDAAGNIVPGTGTVLELKTLAPGGTSNTIMGAVKDALRSHAASGGQSSDIYINASSAPDMTLSEAQRTVFRTANDPKLQNRVGSIVIAGRDTNQATGEAQNYRVTLKITRDGQGNATAEYRAEWQNDNGSWTAADTVTTQNLKTKALTESNAEDAPADTGWWTKGSSVVGGETSTTSQGGGGTADTEGDGSGTGGEVIGGGGDGPFGPLSDNK